MAEYCQVGSLDKVIDLMTKAKGKFTEPVFLTIVAQVAEALSYAHAKDVLHRDITAENIFLKLDGAVKLGKFALESGEKHVSPEATNDKLTAKSDVYSLGCIAFQLLSLKMPFVHEDSAFLMKAIIEEEPTRLSNKDVSQQSSNLVMAMLQKEPDMRPAAADIIDTQFVKVYRGEANNLLLESGDPSINKLIDEGV